MVQTPLTLSQSKGVSGVLSFDPLKWFDKLTMSGFNPRSENRESLAAMYGLVDRHGILL